MLFAEDDAVWMRNSLSAIFGFVAGAVMPFILNWRKQSAESTQKIMTAMSERIAVLESRVESLHNEHAQCLAVQAELRTKIAMLEKGSERA